MLQPIHPNLEFSSEVIKGSPNQPDEVGYPRAARDNAAATGTNADDRFYFSARAEEHGVMAAEAKHPAARAAHLELAERYNERSLDAAHLELAERHNERSLEADDDSWVNEGGSWQQIPRSGASRAEMT